MLLFAIVEVALSTHLVSSYNSRPDEAQARSVHIRVRFITFASWWTVLLGTVLPMLGWFLTDKYMWLFLYGNLMFLTLTWIWWSAAAAAITASLNGGHNCSALPYNLPHCDTLNAVMAFSWIILLIVTIGLVVAIIVVVKWYRSTTDTDDIEQVSTRHLPEYEPIQGIKRPSETPSQQSRRSGNSSYPPKTPAPTFTRLLDMLDD
ncbi:hypothetical protein BKA62DRAFT_702287 [Auriculariales sp. MPI-PUGE-AT-0066]|nr:hypothetical protein BKA62DRAFT_702287 [Auriculariales sp. MPI-PUGE-AT-0066]